jgi:monovalent cation/proton antiporter MnhG/PhaG subunit
VTELVSDVGLTWGFFRELIALCAVVFGGFFLVVGAVGVARFPDAYHRLHASSKCTTLGITGLLLAACFALGDPAIVSKSIAVVALTVVANPLGAHLLAKAAHHAKLPKYAGTLSDELAEDKANPAVPTSDDFLGAPGLDGPAEREWSGSGPSSAARSRGAA